VRGLLSQRLMFSRRVLVVFAVSVVAASAIWLSLRPGRLKRPIRLARYAFQARFTESVFNEIARRREIPIEWVKTDLDVNEALRRGVVDVWAAAATTPERQKEFYVTDIWTHVEFSLLSLDGKELPLTNETPGRRVGYNRRSLNATDVSRALPAAIPVLYESVPASVQAVCSGEVHAVMLARATALESVLKRPAGCEQAAFRYEMLPQAAVPIAILARRDAAREAEAFRAGMSELAEDGTIMKLTTQTIVVADRQSEFISGIMDAERRSRQRLYISTIGISILICGVVLLLKLRGARRAAELASLAKSQFVAAISHEIRTPMNGVVGMTELLLETKLTDLQREFAETVRSSAQSLLAIIGNVLDFSRIEAGMHNTENVIFSPRAMMEETIGMMAHGGHQKGLELGCFAGADLPSEVVGDSNSVRQVLLNLLSNSIKFTPSGVVIVRAGTAARKDGTVEVWFEVSDTGIGIAPEVVPKLFQPFSQADGSTARRFGGTGLGLAISKRLVESMSGKISLESTIGVGTRIRFSGRFIETAAKQESWKGSFEGRRVLVAGAGEISRQMLEEQLTPMKVQVDWAEDCTPGQIYDAILLDSKEPCMEGWSPADVGGWRPGVPVILLTIHESHQQLDEAKRAGIEEFLYKPLRPAKLACCLENVFAGPKAAKGKEVPDDDPLNAVAAGRRPRILVAEDNPVNQRVARRMLERLGYDVDIAENGRRAIDALNALAYDAVLMDCSMPEMDGFEATREIRRSHGTKTVIIAMTAGALADDEERCRLAGMDDYLTKPVNIETLRIILERWIPLAPFGIA
jgi:signal transduction histidine kinase/CheY-like chemotaxis protein